MNKAELYPSLDDLMPEVLLARIPASLADCIEERYTGLGTKYITDKQTEDGRFINGCMFKSSIQDALEEVVDAVFNTLVWIFKLGSDNNNQFYKDGVEATSILMGLIEIYSLLKIAQERNVANL